MSTDSLIIEAIGLGSIRHCAHHAADAIRVAPNQSFASTGCGGRAFERFLGGGRGCA
jgi:hypothetical protein